MKKLLFSLFRTKFEIFVVALIVITFVFYQFMLEEMVVSYSVYKYKELHPMVLEDKYQSMKKILYYNPFFSRSDYSFGFGHQPFENNNCPIKNCIATNNRHLLGKNLLLKISRRRVRVLEGKRY